MPTGVDPDTLVDTSVAVALVVADHDHHATVKAALADQRLGLAGHAGFETFSVLTRLPPPLRRTPTSVQALLDSNFPASRFLDADTSAALLGRLASLGLAGGAVYDALVGETAVHHRLALATRDRRALDVYRRVEADVTFLA